MMKMVFLVLSMFLLGAGYLVKTRRVHNREALRARAPDCTSCLTGSSSTESPSSYDSPYSSEPRSSPDRTLSRDLDPDPDPSPSLHVAHTLSSAGWILFGLYWALHYPEYSSMGDWVNAGFSVAALPLFVYIGFRETAASSPDQSIEHEGLRFLTGITVVSMTGYTILSLVPSVELALEYVNAYLTSLFLTLTGFPAEAGQLDLAGNTPWLRSNDALLSVPIVHRGRDEILITLSCTAFSSILLFLAAIMTAREPLIHRIRTAMIIIPAIVLFNVIRMAMITYFTYTGATSAAFAHHVLGKAGSLLALLFLAWVLLTFLPSIMVSISAVFDELIPARDRKGPEY